MHSAIDLDAQEVFSFVKVAAVNPDLTTPVSNGVHTPHSSFSKGYESGNPNSGNRYTEQNLNDVHSSYSSRMNTLTSSSNNLVINNNFMQTTDRLGLNASNSSLLTIGQYARKSGQTSSTPKFSLNELKNAKPSFRRPKVEPKSILSNQVLGN